MISVTLRLRNFLSYGEEVAPLDFTSFDVACLSGQNGHGKSAVLDGITWALWGEGRKASGDKSGYEGLLRIGATEMEVEFSFDLEGERYRVWRRWKKKTAGGTPTLEFQVYDHSKDAFIPLTGSSIRATQQKINQFLRMDYSTFINSAFILQGRADEFTRQTPGKRKEILAEILGLNHYEDLAKKAKEHRDAAEQQRIQLQAQLDMIQRVVTEEPELTHRLEVLTSEMETLAVQISTHEQSIAALQTERADLTAKQGQIKDMSIQLEQLRKERQELERQLQELDRQIRGDQAVAAGAGQIQAAYQRYFELTQAKDQWLAKLQEHNRLEAEAVALEKAITQARYQLEQRRQAAVLKLGELQKIMDAGAELEAAAPRIAAGYHEWQQARQEEAQWQEKWRLFQQLEKERGPLEQRIEQARQVLAVELGTLAAKEADSIRRAAERPRHEQLRSQALQAAQVFSGKEREREQIQEQGTQTAAAMAAAAADLKQGQRELEELEEKLAILTHGEEAACPLCHSELDAERRCALQAELQTQIKAARQQAAELHRQGKDAEQRRQSLLKRWEVVTADLKQKPKVDQALAQAEAGIEEARRAQEEVLQAQRAKAIMQQRLSAKDYAQAEQEQLRRVLEGLQALAFTPQAFQQAGKRREQLEGFVTQQAMLADAQRRLGQVRGELPAVQNVAETLTTQIKSGTFAAVEQEQLTATRRKQTELGYHPGQHRAVEQAWKQLQDAPTHMERLTQSARRLDANLKRQAEMQAKGQALQAAELAAQAKLTVLVSESQRLPQLASQLKAAEDELKQLRLNRDQKVQQSGGLQAQVARCQELRQERELAEQQRRQAAYEKGLYDQLVVAFGKDGIPALIIEQAIPEIEAEANEILARLTDNRTQVTIESQKETASGAKETLEIKISDELGTRDYELYSGGEAFRCNFALRIALSKLLARRSGTRLRTLVIDEGFGTQDAEGLEHLVDAIQTVRLDFDKILVITHLDALKNAFPVRIEVTKHPEIGSRFEVVHL